MLEKGVSGPCDLMFAKHQIQDGNRTAGATLLWNMDHSCWAWGLLTVYRPLMMVPALQVREGHWHHCRSTLV
jgi:hypothetical protein